MDIELIGVGCAVRWWKLRRPEEPVAEVDTDLERESLLHNEISRQRSQEGIGNFWAIQHSIHVGMRVNQSEAIADFQGNCIG